VLVVTTTVGVLHRVHGHTTHLGVEKNVQQYCQYTVPYPVSMDAGMLHLDDGCWHRLPCMNCTPHCISCPTSLSHAGPTTADFSLKLAVHGASGNHSCLHLGWEPILSPCTETSLPCLIAGAGFTMLHSPCCHLLIAAALAVT
jgi:hypothetical protein